MRYRRAQATARIYRPHGEARLIAGSAFHIDDSTDVLFERFADLHSLGVRQTGSVEINHANIVGFALDRIGCSAERFPSDSDEVEQYCVQRADDGNSKLGEIVVGMAHIEVDET
jgi:hypothetical protein